MRKYLLSAIFTFSLFSIYAQDLNIKANVGNPSNLINDGFIDLEVEGGTPPYTYKWDNQSTLLTSSRSEGLVEGVPYSVVVTDSKGASSQKTYSVKAEAITEHFNGAFKPLVAQMEKVLFWDLFTAIGIYDPVVYADIRN
ncbi:MAG: SprB repeat-containing protein, partial [Flavobacteriaceae bacterium]|nr:SprB repeat-containing protein [Flavobacteriaceae bacterium]